MTAVERPEGAPVRRGRRRKSDASAADARTLIIAAASAQFAADGYDATSLRAIARKAGVDPALVHHYFTDKAELFAISLGAPIRPDLIARQVLAGPRENIGENIVRLALRQLDAPGARDRVIALVRASLSHEFAATMLRQFLRREVYGRIAAAVGGEHAELRASLVSSYLMGMAVLRYGIRVEPMASVSVEDLVRRMAPVVQWQLTGPLDEAPIDIVNDRRS